MDYTAVRRTGAQTLTYSTRSGMEILLVVLYVHGNVVGTRISVHNFPPVFLFGKNPVFFPAEKSIIFLCRKISYFSVWKNRGFLLAVLYWTVDTGRDSSGRWTVDGTVDRTARDSGRDSGTARDSGQWTDGLSSMGQLNTGRAILYWTDAARGRWTVDAGQVDSGRDRVDRNTVPTLEY